MSKYIPAFQEHAAEPPAIYDLLELCERSGVLTLTLIAASGRRLGLTFSTVLAYRKAGESDSLVTLDEIYATTQPARSFYGVEGSQYLQWFINQGHGIQDPTVLKHFTILTVDDVIDVIAISDPVVDWNE